MQHSGKLAVVLLDVLLNGVHFLFLVHLRVLALILVLVTVEIRFYPIHEHIAVFKIVLGRIEVHTAGKLRFCALQDIHGELLVILTLLVH